MWAFLPSLVFRPSVHPSWLTLLSLIFDMLMLVRTSTKKSQLHLDAAKSMAAIYNSWSRNCLPFRTPEFTPVFSVVRVAQSLVFCVVYWRSLFVLFILAILLSVLFRFTASDYPFGVIKLFLCKIGRNF